MKTNGRQIDVQAHPPASIWPDRSQLCLLRAALWSGEEARAAWTEWQKITKLASLDVSSWNLLPLVWRNLSNQGLSDDPLVAECRGYYRYHWAKNQVLLTARRAGSRRGRPGGFPWWC